MQYFLKSGIQVAVVLGAARKRVHTVPVCFIGRVDCACVLPITSDAQYHLGVLDEEVMAVE